MLKTKYKVSKLNHIGNDRKFSVFKCTILRNVFPITYFLFFSCNILIITSLGIFVYTVTI